MRRPPPFSRPLPWEPRAAPPPFTAAFRFRSRGRKRGATSAPGRCHVVPRLRTATGAKWRRSCGAGCWRWRWRWRPSRGGRCRSGCGGGRRPAGCAPGGGTCSTCTTRVTWRMAPSSTAASAGTSPSSSRWAPAKSSRAGTRGYWGCVRGRSGSW